MYLDVCFVDMLGFGGKCMAVSPCASSAEKAFALHVLKDWSIQKILKAAGEGGKERS